MIDIKKASQIAKKTLYGASIVCVPKNGEDPYLMNASDPERIWESAIKIL